MTKPTKSDCHGCRDDHYNIEGNSFVGECWSFAKATMEKVRLVPLDMYPPWDRVKVETKPSCFKRQGCARVKVEKK